MAPPAASAESAWITRTFMESTRETAEMAADHGVYRAHQAGKELFHDDGNKELAQIGVGI